MLTDFISSLTGMQEARPHICTELFRVSFLSTLFLCGPFLKSVRIGCNIASGLCFGFFFFFGRERHVRS